MALLICHKYTARKDTCSRFFTFGLFSSSECPLFVILVVQLLEEKKGERKKEKPYRGFDIIK